MMTRILPLLLICVPLAACEQGRSLVARGDGEVRFDTAAGFRLGMLLPEARAAATQHEESLECRVVAMDPDPADRLDSLRQPTPQVHLCHATGRRAYTLQFEEGSLRVIVVPMDEDWRFVPVDTVVSRLSRMYGKPVKRLTYSTGGGRTEEAISWTRKGERGGVGVRCPTTRGAGICVMEYHLLSPDARPDGR